MTSSNNIQLDIVKRDLVLANHILASEGVVDSFGHVSVRHPAKADRYLLSRAISPEQVTVDNIIEFSLDGVPTDGRTDSPYFERFIHGAVYEAVATGEIDRIQPVIDSAADRAWDNWRKRVTRPD